MQTVAGDVITVNFIVASGSSPDQYTTIVNGKTQVFPAAAVGGISISTLGGNDSTTVNIPEVLDYIS